MRRALIVLIALLALAGCTSGRSSAPSSSSRATSAPRPSASPTTTEPPKPRTATVLGTGDVLIHPPLTAQAAADATAEGQPGTYDFGPIIASIKPVVSKVDLATCEMETALAPPTGPFAGYPDFNAPPQVLTALVGVGYKSCTTASNHTLDQGPDGVTRTLNELDAAGLKHTGSARTAAEAATPLIITTASGIKIAQLAYTFDFNGLSTPPGEPWMANLTDIPTILAAAHQAKLAGADIVVLSMHWGTEYDHLPTSVQTTQAQQLLASPDIDVILGDHAHAVQPLQQIGDKWVIYCMGDQISAHDPPNNDNREGVMPIFTFTEVSPGVFKTTKVEIVPTWMSLAPTIRLINLPAALADPSLAPDVRATYQQAHDRIVGYLTALGAPPSVVD